ncbi:hypothetical protein CKK33_02345 [Mucilaginibacter sp. MD40]|uniref:hypothetical protein n=1 Tax=Mucilaginibacter sp. MD40 TaxID=2029590 RepID=UPI000BAC82E4|nr:hypothetical protein [Mucilaginibacter sp. MD40]PAW92395.1 hypothetical protein CKK33_02345 [Mucilaginibacter sp. MD40]
MAKQDNMAPGQQHAPENGKQSYRPDEATGDEIIKGARNTDQLEEQEQNAAESPEEQHVGASPTKDLITQEDTLAGHKTYEVAQSGHPALETKDGKNNGAIPSAFDGQQPNHP